MSTSTALTVGVMLGWLVAAFVILSVLVRFVSSDLDGFRRWLDKAEP